MSESQDRIIAAVTERPLGEEPDRVYINWSNPDE